MFKRFAKTLLSAAAPLTLVVSLASAASAANVDYENGTWQPDRGQGLSQVAAEIEAQTGIEIDYLDLAAANPSIDTKDYTVNLGETYNLPAEFMEAYAAAKAPSAEDVDAVIAKVVAQFSKIPAPELNFADLAPASFNPFDMWGVKSDIVLAQATTEPAPEVAVETPVFEAPAEEVVTVDAEDADDAEKGTFLRGTPSDEELFFASEDWKLEKLKGGLANYSEDHLPAHMVGYDLALSLAVAANSDISVGEKRDYDGLFSAIPDEMVAAEIKARNPNLIDDEVKRAVQGYQVGVRQAIANDEKCDDLTKEFFDDFAKVALSEQPDVVQQLMANIGWEAYAKGIDVEECDGCGITESVRPEPRPETPEITTIPVHKTGSLCATIDSTMKDGIGYDFMQVVNLNPDQVYTTLNPFGVLDYQLNSSKPLSIMGLEEVTEQTSAEYKALCEGPGWPAMPVPLTLHTPSVTSVHPSVSSLVPTHPQCSVVRWKGDAQGIFRLVTQRDNVEACCVGNEYTEKDPSGNVLWTLRGGDSGGVCRDGDGPQPAPVEQPGGGCQTNGCGGGGGNPNDDLGGGGKTPPGPKSPGMN